MLSLLLLLAQGQPVAPVEVVPAARAAPEAQTLLLGHHERLLFERDIRRVAVADPEVLGAEALDSRELLVTAIRPGVSSVIVWLETGEPVAHLFTVRRDLTMLSSIVASIDPGIEVELAPDRDLIVLEGTVPNASVRDAAEAAVEAYLGAGEGQVEGVPLLAEPPPAEDGALAPGGAAGIATDIGARAPGRRARRGAGIVNLLRVSELPPTLESRIARSIAPLSDGRVTVRRIQLGDFQDDESDVFLLEGEVTDQVALTRVLFVASRALQGRGSGANSDVRALADEAGALTQIQNIFGAGNVGGGAQGGGALQSVANAALGGGGGQQAAQLANRIGAQVGRAKVVEAAGGRLLSTIQVEHLPLVRVDVRLYEVNRSKLRTWRNELRVAAANFDQTALLPSPEAMALQGGAAGSVGDDDIQGILGFLGGTLAGRTQGVSGGFAVDNLFQILVEEQVARSLSNPSLAVLSGELAQFQVGGQIPIPLAVTVGGGTDQVLNAVEFRDFGIDLTVRPLVEERSSGRITLDVVPRISLPDLALTAAIGNATGQPSAATAFESRATRTHARVFDGEALVIGGLTTERSQSAQGRVPLLGSLPVLGWLFRNEADDREETELVLVVIPSVVREPRPEADLWAFPTAAEVHARLSERISGSGSAR